MDLVAARCQLNAQLSSHNATAAVCRVARDSYFHCPCRFAPTRQRAMSFVGLLCSCCCPLGATRASRTYGIDSSGTLEDSTILKGPHKKSALSFDVPKLLWSLLK